MTFPIFETARYAPGTPERDDEEKRLYAARVEHVARALWEAANEMEAPGFPWADVAELERSAWRFDAIRILESYVRSA